jgi:type VI protein secretion system component Hcp
MEAHGQQIECIEIVNLEVEELESRIAPFAPFTISKPIDVATPKLS